MSCVFGIALLDSNASGAGAAGLLSERKASGVVAALPAGAAGSHLRGHVVAVVDGKRGIVLPAGAAGRLLRGRVLAAVAVPHGFTGEGMEEYS